PQFVAHWSLLIFGPLGYRADTQHWRVAVRHTWRIAICLTALAGALSLARPATAESVWVEGLPDCGTWVQARTAAKARVLEAYLLGVLNGAAIGAQLEFWLAGGILVNREQVYLWMDNYCRNSPLSNIVEGAGALMNERTKGALA